MNLPLLKLMLKINMKGVSNYAFGSAFYIVIMFWLYPGIADNSGALNDLLASMPDGLVSAFNIQGGFGSMEAFISGEYYGLILPILLSIFTIMVSTGLMARLVDQGSMAYLLSTPTSRRRIAMTQASVLAFGLLMILLITTAAGYLGYFWFIGDRYEFDSSRFLLMNTVALALFIAIGGISFLVSSVANDEKKALGLSGAIVFGMFGLDMLGKISENVEWLRFASLFALYQPSEIASGGGNPLLSSAILLAVGIVAFAAGIVSFSKRDLPL
ncbi:ABC transporter permease subunit [Paenibacillus harenae]|uniref:ABC-2 type transport system permease protein n=1 Tax=Paenibacillus harenae TaxID=306543 RepID=A0ABT9TXW1_PAEHA|nr:ABC transporter permease subunit [Paenibacillus harenae]MDQ0060287.1 ABC-2 type transport system permease protein [Paenibacillus harenae]MDQ0112176.1 ABC-2 type transport system permease protein [Paenibacillus harenae]